MLKKWINWARWVVEIDCKRQETRCCNRIESTGRLKTSAHHAQRGHRPQPFLIRCPGKKFETKDFCEAHHHSTQLHTHSIYQTPTTTMHLMYTLGPDGKRVYTLQKTTEDGEITKSAHPARFSPDDKYSRHRVTLKKRFGLLPTQQEAIKY